MVHDTVGGLLRILACTAFAALVVGGVLYRRELVSRSVRIGRVLRVVPRPAPAPEGPPLERIVRDLRRVQAEARRPGHGATWAKYRGAVAAYDDLLLDACRALGVPTTLASMPEGLERESERLRVEFELERAGVPLRADAR